MVGISELQRLAFLSVKKIADGIAAIVDGVRGFIF
jgi:hypothetical protein